MKRSRIYPETNNKALLLSISPGKSRLKGNVKKHILSGICGNLTYDINLFDDRTSQQSNKLDLLVVKSVIKSNFSIADRFRYYLYIQVFI